ncbi:MAG: hypothetical protein AAB386_01195 [Patescibacteria group bacterium]
MKLINLFGATFAVALLGAGCFPGPALQSPKVSEPIGAALPARPINQVKGFGDIPAAPLASLRPGNRGSVIVRAELPSVPEVVTVLRQKGGQPDETVLRNIAGSIWMPGGTIGTHPVTREIRLDWRDENGVQWIYKGRERRTEFTDTSKPRKALTVSSWPTTERVIQSAVSFLNQRGISQSRYGTPFIEPDWALWLNAEKAAGHCVDKEALQTIRVMATMTDLRQSDLPKLPEIGKVSCLNAELPARITVRINATQDGQAIYSDDGTPYPAAILVVDAVSLEVVSGSFIAGADPDRSDYPALSFEEVRRRLAQGGQGGTPQGDVTIDDAAFEWYRIESREDPPTSYLFPALVGSGAITYPDKQVGSYRIIVPLVK